MTLECLSELLNVTRTIITHRVQVPPEDGLGGEYLGPKRPQDGHGPLGYTVYTVPVPSKQKSLDAPSATRTTNLG